MTFIKALFLQWGLLSTLLVFIQAVLLIVALVSPLRPNGLRCMIAAGYLFIADCIVRIVYVLTSSYGPEVQRGAMITDLLRCVLLAMLVPGVFSVLLILKAAIASPAPWRLPLAGLGGIAVLAVGVVVAALLLASMLSR